jgi:hypothetical protein
LAFSTPENAPTEIPLGEKKVGEKKRSQKSPPPPKKVRALPFVLARWRKKKVGAEQEKVTRFILNSA